MARIHAGAGKSLCYQIPALLSGGLVLVVAPLIAVRNDQLAHLPPGLRGAMLWFGQQASEALRTLAAIKVCSSSPCLQRSITMQMPYSCLPLKFRVKHVYCMG